MNPFLAIAAVVLGLGLLTNARNSETVASEPMPEPSPEPEPTPEPPASDDPLDDVINSDEE